MNIYGLIGVLGEVASKAPFVHFDFDLIAQSFAFTKWGAVAALAGGLLTWVLHARAERFRQVAAEQDGT